MKTSIFIYSLLKISVFFLIILNLSHCGLYKKTDARDIPVNAKDRMAKNIEEGKSFKFGKLGKGGSGTFEFASSNEMWRAAIEILDFVPIASADYGGGIIITDWYNDTDKENESIKIMVQFLSNEIRADGLKIVVYDKVCKKTNLVNCKTNINNSTVSEEIKLAILRKASIYKTSKDKINAENYRKKKPIKNKKIKSN